MDTKMIANLLYWIFVVYVLLFVPGGWWIIPFGLFMGLVYRGAKKVVKNFKK